MAKVFWLGAALLALVSGGIASAAEKHKVLVVLSGVDYVTLKSGKTHPTGYFLSEFAVPLMKLVRAGYEPIFANPTGETPAMDKISDDQKWFKSEEEYQAAKAFLAGRGDFAHPKKLSALNEEDLEGFDGLMLPGGHAPMEDLYRDRDLGRILKYFHKEAKPTGLICHAPVALLAAKDAGAEWIYKDYKMTVFSTAEEKQEEAAGHLDGDLTYYVAKALEDVGAKVSVAAPWTSNVVRDRELITGQNPMSEYAFADELLAALAEFQMKGRAKRKWVGSIVPGTIYQVSRGETDWKAGYSTIYVGVRRPEYPAGKFLDRLGWHVDKTWDLLKGEGLKGYLFMTNGELEIAYLNWESKETLDKIFAGEHGKFVAADASKFMETLVFKEMNP